MLMPSRALARHTNGHAKLFPTTRAALYMATAALIACAALLAPSFFERRSDASTAGGRGASAESGHNWKMAGARSAPHNEGRGDASKRAAINSAYGRLPVAFIANGGQLDPSVAFSARGAGYQLFLTDAGAVLALDAHEDARDGDDAASRDSGAVLHMNLTGARRASGVSGERPLEGKANYFVGGDPSKWRTNVETYSAVRYEGVYPGVDLIYHGDQRQLEYDFRVSPGADPRQIKIDFDGARALKIDHEGQLFVRVGESYVTQHKPVAYQIVGGERRQVSARYHVNMRGEVSFRLGRYDHTLPLVIDPIISYATYLGGSGTDQANAVAVDSAGNVYVVGQTISANFPTAGALQPARGGTNRDAFVTKLNPAGTALVYSTFLGGSLNDTGNAVAVDSAGNAYVTGSTFSTDFPHTAGALQQSNAGAGDAFVAKLSAAGDALVYSTFLGGVSGETGYGVGVDAAGNAYVAGAASSPSIGGVTLPKRGSPAYKSADAGASWSAVKNGVTDPAFNAITVDPTNGSTLYAAGSVVFKSTDGGATWAATPPLVVTPTLNATPNSVAVDPAAPSTLYAATAFGVYKSTDSGASWAASSNGLVNGGQDVLAAHIDPSNHSTLYAGTLGGVFKSTNGGANWAAANTGLNFSQPEVLALAFDPTNTATIYIGTARGVFKSTNAGASWGAPVNFNGTSIVSLAVDPSAPGTVYAASRLGVSKSTDGGANWSPSSNGLTVTSEGTTFNVGVNALAINPLAPAALYAATYVGVFKSTDGGANWSPADNGLANMTVNDIAVDRTSPANVYAATSSGGEAFAAKLNPTGTALGYIVYLGGDEDDRARGVAVDAAGNAYVAGTTNSANFPVANAEQPAYGGGGDAFVTKLASDGSLLYSTYLGGGNFDEAAAVAVDPAGRAYVTGDTISGSFPVTTTRKPHDPTFYDAFVARLNPAGSALDYSFLFGGSDMDQGFGIAADAAGNAYVTGYTGSFVDFPLVNAAQTTYGSAFALKINADGSVGYSTYLGGPGGDQGLAIAADQSGAAYVAGKTVSSGFPVTSSAFQRTYGGGSDAFAVRIGSAADMGVAISVPRDTVMTGSQLTYTIQVSNAGPSSAVATLTDALPAGVTLASATPSQGSCAGTTTITCSLGEMAAGSSATVSIAVTPNAPGPLNNTVSVAGSEFDPNTANNTASRAVTVSAHPSIAGRVSGAGASANVSVSLSGTMSAAATPDADSYYQFTELAEGGNYVVKPSKPGFTFTPLSLSFNDLRQDATADFVSAPCSYSLSPATQTIPGSGGAGTVAVTANGDCPWTAASGSDWITITSGQSGAGNGAVTFRAAPTSAPRSGRLIIAGQTYAVWQEFNSCGAPTFNVALYNLPYSPTIIKAADLNGDGSLDLVAITSALTGGGLRGSVMLNDSHGHFSTSQFDLGIGGMQGFALADFNGDGRPDIAMSSYNFNSVRVLFNNGGGGFGQSAAQIPFSTQGQSPLTQGIATADFNRDGKADLVVATPGTNSVQILLGDGAGAFTQAAAVAVGNTWNFVGVADVDSDGVPDIVLSNNNSSSPQISVMRGNGLGGFGAPVTSATAGPVSSFSTGDFDGDGRLDLVAPSTVPDANSTPSNPSFRYVILVLSGDGAGHFTQKSVTDALAGERIFHLAVADFNNDAKPDVASSGFTDSAGYSVAVRLGNGTGGFGAPIVTGTGGNPIYPGIADLAAADFDGDSRADIAGADYTRGAVVLTNNCDRQPSIFGNVGLAGVSVTLSGTQSATTQTDGNGNYLFGGLTAGGNYVVTPSKENYRFSPASAAVNGLAAGGREVDFTATAMTVSFTPIQYLVNENSNSLRVGVMRSGDTSGAATVSYATVDNPAAVRCDDTTTMPGVAFARCDYATTVGTVTFAPGETTKIFTVPIIDDVHVEGPETFSIRLFTPTGAALGTPSTVTATILDNDSPGQANPINSTPFFVRMQYLDFLSRDPEPGEPWSSTLNNCAAGDPLCDRISVSANFFRSQEFQLKGLFVFKFYKVAFGRMPLYSEIVSDMSSVTGTTTAELIAKKGAYTTAFAQRQEFASAYGAVADQQFVDTLMSRYNLQSITTINPASPDDSQAPRMTLTRAQIVSQLTAGTLTRGQVVRAMADSNEVSSAEFNPAFVAMQYFGYLRRDPEADGYNAWLRTINANPSDTRSMVNGFVNSTEYRLRFGQP